MVGGGTESLIVESSSFLEFPPSPLLFPVPVEGSTLGLALGSKLGSVDGKTIGKLIEMLFGILKSPFGSCPKGGMLPSPFADIFFDGTLFLVLRRDIIASLSNSRNSILLIGCLVRSLYDSSLALLSMKLSKGGSEPNAASLGHFSQQDTATSHSVSTKPSDSCVVIL